MDCKLFVSDLDGTLLVDRGQDGVFTTDRSRAALRALQRQGVTVCLASGRMHESIRHIAADLNVIGPVISYNGAMLRDHQDQVLTHQRVEPGLAAELIDLAEARELELNFYLEGSLLARNLEPWWDLYHGRTSSPMVAVDSLLPYRGQSPTKLLIFSDAATIRGLKEELAPLVKDRAIMVVTADQYLEFMPLGTDKGHALADLAARLGLTAAQVVAVGDGNNDLGMVSWAGHGLATRDGRQALIDVADELVDPPAQDGVAVWIENNLLR